MLFETAPIVNSGSSQVAKDYAKDFIPNFRWFNACHTDYERLHSSTKNLKNGAIVLFLL